MSWAYYSGELTDIWPGADVYEGATATAAMVGMGDSSYFRVQLKGLDEDLVGKEYGAHLHNGPCGITDPDDAATATVGGHYNISPPKPGTTLPSVISDKTEVWLNFKVNSEGNSRDQATVSFIPEEGPRSIVFHADPTAETGSAGARLACLPFNINIYGN